MEQWVNLEHLGYSRYAISSFGNVASNRTGECLTISRNQTGTYRVSLISDSDKVQRQLSVPLLVARTFVPIEDELVDRFNTPINLNGRRNDNRAENLLWRPRWFAIKYHQQFHNGRRGFEVPIIETETEEAFPTSWEAATKYGLIDREIMLAISNREGQVFPTNQKFELMPVELRHEFFPDMYYVVE